MPKSKKSRESVPPRGSQMIDGELIHTATNQKLYYQTHICTVFRETLKPTEEFSRLNMVRTMDKNLKKRQAHGIGSILEDRLTLEKEKKSGKEPFRPYVYYREIKDVQRSKVKPEYFAISVDSEKSGSKYYEVYKCKTKEDANKMESYIKQAMDNPNHRITDGPVLDVVPVVENPDMRRSLVHVEFQTSLESLDENGGGRTSTICQVTSPTPPQGMDYTPPTIPRYSPVPAPVVYKQPLMAAAAPSPPRRRSPSPPPTRRHQSMDGMNDVTYISFEPKTRRPIVTDTGPVYMYLSRQKNSGSQRASDHGRGATSNYDSVMYNGRNSDYYRY